MIASVVLGIGREKGLHFAEKAKKKKEGLKKKCASLRLINNKDPKRERSLTFQVLCNPQGGGEHPLFLKKEKKKKNT